MKEPFPLLSLLLLPGALLGLAGHAQEPARGLLLEDLTWLQA